MANFHSYTRDFRIAAHLSGTRISLALRNHQGRAVILRTATLVLFLFWALLAYGLYSLA